MGNKNFIVINGKKYDALTGKLLQSNSFDSKPSTTVIKPSVSTNNSGVVDGFVRRQPTKKPRTSSAQHALKQTQKSQTLMRGAVKKPSAQPKRSTHSSGPTIHKSQLGVSHHRAQAALATPKSEHIKKYGDISSRSSVVKTQQHLPVAEHKTKIQTEHNEISAKNHATSASKKVIEAALANANSHEQEHASHSKKRKKNRILKKLGLSSRAVSVSCLVLAIVLFGGFIAVQNIPNLSMKVASTRSGVQASMPSYTPSGFSFKAPINYSTGKVTVSFKSNVDDRQYNVTQTTSNWNSDALLANYVEAENKQYQTYVDRGRTLYIYDGSNATWVDNGIWYNVEGESNMTTDQLIRIAASI